MLFLVYAWPNILLPLLGGILIDKIGVRRGIALYSLLITIGQWLFMMSGFVQSYTSAIAGRAVFGLGGECLKVAQYTIISIWFMGQELNFAMALTIGISQFASVINGWVLPEIFEDHGLGDALMVGLIVCVVSLLAGYMLCFLDSRADKYLKDAGLLLYHQVGDYEVEG